MDPWNCTLTAATVLEPTTDVDRLARLWARASETFERDPSEGWLDQRGPWTFGLNQHGHATMSSATLTIAEDGHGGIEWYIERNGMVGHGNRTVNGQGRTVGHAHVGRPELN